MKEKTVCILNLGKKFECTQIWRKVQRAKVYKHLPRDQAHIGDEPHTVAQRTNTIATKTKLVIKLTAVFTTIYSRHLPSQTKLNAVSFSMIFMVLVCAFIFPIEIKRNETKHKYRILNVIISMHIAHGKQYGAVQCSAAWQFYRIHCLSIFHSIFFFFIKQCSKEL